MQGNPWTTQVMQRLDALETKLQSTEKDAKQANDRAKAARDYLIVTLVMWVASVALAAIAIVASERPY